MFKNIKIKFTQIEHITFLMWVPLMRDKSKMAAKIRDIIKVWLYLQSYCTGGDFSV